MAFLIFISIYVISIFIVWLITLITLWDRLHTIEDFLCPDSSGIQFVPLYNTVFAIVVVGSIIYDTILKKIFNIKIK